MTFIFKNWDLWNQGVEGYDLKTSVIVCQLETGPRVRACFQLHTTYSIFGREFQGRNSYTAYSVAICGWAVCPKSTLVKILPLWLEPFSSQPNFVKVEKSLIENRQAGEHAYFQLSMPLTEEGIWLSCWSSCLDFPRIMNGNLEKSAEINPFFPKLHLSDSFIPMTRIKW